MRNPSSWTLVVDSIPLPEYQWALSWSLPGCWRALAAPPAGAGAAGDLRALDGVRVLCMMCVIVEHVCWLSALSYVDDIRYFETVSSPLLNLSSI